MKRQKKNTYFKKQHEGSVVFYTSKSKREGIIDAA